MNQFGDQPREVPARSWAYGEFAFSKEGNRPQVDVRLVNQTGAVLETVALET